MTLASVFRKTKVFLPVVHTLDIRQVLNSVDVAVDNGADGVFLINQNMSTQWVLDLALPHVRQNHPTLWVGLNDLGAGYHTVMENLWNHNIGGVWTDSSGVGEDYRDQWGEEAAEYRNYLMGQNGDRGLWFGGVAFKYRAEVPADEIPDLVERGKEFLDVVVTTGKATGQAADLSKIKTFHDALGGHPLGIASGITPENIGEYLPYVDAFLVATGIEQSFGILDAKRVRSIADSIAQVSHGCEQAQPTP